MGDEKLGTHSQPHSGTAHLSEGQLRTNVPADHQQSLLRRRLLGPQWHVLWGSSISQISSSVGHDS